MNKLGSENTKRIILLNGPAGSGKDTAANIINQKLSGLTYRYKISLPLKEAAHKLLGLQGTLEDLEPLKELPIKFIVDSKYNNWSTMKLTNEIGEMSLRQFYIHVSEHFMKPMFGEDIFGRLAVENLLQCHHAVITVSDSGFAPEALPIINHFGKDHVCLVRLHRPGRTFAGDSRTHIELPVDVSLDIENDIEMDKFGDRLWRKLKKNFLIGTL